MVKEIMTQQERTKQVDLSLAVLECLAVKGEPMTQRQIGEVCGVSHGAIQSIERRAVKNLIREIKKAFGGKIPAEIDARKAFQ